LQHPQSSRLRLLKNLQQKSPLLRKRPQKNQPPRLNLRKRKLRLPLRQRLKKKSQQKRKKRRRSSLQLKSRY
jgi:hypothetical protein